MDSRRQQLQQWVLQKLSELNIEPKGALEVVSGDASFRRYFRQPVSASEVPSFIAVDAPPEKEDSHPFVDIAKDWLAHGVNVPELIHVDLEQGFMLLSDFGDQLLLPALNDDTADTLYGQAIDSLIHIQQSEKPLPPYDQALLDREMALFKDWYLEEELGMTLTRSDENILKDTFDLLRETALGQPQVPVHRDYHSRNLMVLDDGNLGVLDFQDAVYGPYTYDLVSLLRDCYIDWPQDKVEQWAHHYFKLAHENGIAGGMSIEQQMLWFDWMGVQRHLKAVGIFSRLNHRDGKSGYLNDIPRTLNYIVQVSAKYDALHPFNQWLELKVLPLQTQKESMQS